MSLKLPPQKMGRPYFYASGAPATPVICPAAAAFGGPASIHQMMRDRHLGRLSRYRVTTHTHYYFSHAVYVAFQANQ